MKRPLSNPLSSLCCSLLFFLACSPGPGSEAADFDAGRPTPTDGPHLVPWDDVRTDAGASEDAGPAPSDPEPQPKYFFTGVFGIAGSPQSVIAREVDGRLLLMIRRFPQVYVGDIDEAGQFSLKSPIQLRSGCAKAEIQGQFDRVALRYQLHYEGCEDTEPTPVTGNMEGRFMHAFDADRSGVFEGRAEVLSDACEPKADAATVRWTVNVYGFAPTLRMLMWPAIEPFSPDAAYFGVMDVEKQSLPGTAWSTQAEQVAAGGVGLDGHFVQKNLNDPLVLSGRRQVFDPDSGCVYPLDFSLTRRPE